MRILSLTVGVALLGCVGCSGDTSRGAEGPDSGSRAEGPGGRNATDGTGGATGGGTGSTTGTGGRAGGRGGRTGSMGGANANGGSTNANGGSTNANGGSTNASGGANESGGASANGGASSDMKTFGKTYSGGEFHLGPVDYDETEWHNACAPGTKYAASVRAAEGNLLAGLWNGIPDVASYCDACIAVKTAKGKSAVLRVVTYGDTTMNSIDVSPQAYDILNSGEYPRSMSFQFVECPDTGKMMYEFQTGSNEYWTSFWLRNARFPLTKVEVQSKNHPSYVTLDRGTDGTLTDGSGFGAGAFSIRSTALDGTQVVDSFMWPSGGIAGAMLTGKGNFN